MMMTSDKAQELNKVLSQMREFERQYHVCLQRGQMNGYPIRMMDECKQQLKNSVHFGLPDPAAFPELHAHMQPLYTAWLAAAEAQRQKEELEKSPLAITRAAMLLLQRNIAESEQRKRDYEAEAERMSRKAAKEQELQQEMYQELTRLQISLM